MSCGRFLHPQKHISWGRCDWQRGGRIGDPTLQLKARLPRAYLLTFLPSNLDPYTFQSFFALRRSSYLDDNLRVGGSSAFIPHLHPVARFPPSSFISFLARHTASVTRSQSCHLSSTDLQEALVNLQTALPSLYTLERVITAFRMKPFIYRPATSKSTPEVLAT